MNQGQTITILRLRSSGLGPRIMFWVGAPALLSMGFLILSHEVAIGSLRPIDLAVAAAFQAIWWSPLWPLFEAIAVAGGIELTTLIAAVLFLYLLWRRHWRHSLAPLAFPFGLLVETIAKHFVNHSQPPISHAGRLSVTALVQGQVNSYPSGHVVRSIIVYGLVALTVRRLASGGLAKRIVIPVAALLVAAIAFDRLYLAVHWMSDVVGGIILGCLSLALVGLWQALVELAGLASEER